MDRLFVFLKVNEYYYKTRATLFSTSSTTVLTISKENK